MRRLIAIVLLLAAFVTDSGAETRERLIVPAGKGNHYAHAIQEI
jgi:hypothetical protein